MPVYCSQALFEILFYEQPAQGCTNWGSLTAEILEEVRRNLVKKEISPENAKRLIAEIRKYFNDSFIYGYEPLISAMPINEKDRHVLAAAVACKAQIIVTQNLRDFPDYLLSIFQIEAHSPDKFLVSLFLARPETMVEIVLRQATNLRKPSMTVYEVLDRLNLHVPIFASLVRKELDEQILEMRTGDIQGKMHLALDITCSL